MLTCKKKSATEKQHIKLTDKTQNVTCRVFSCCKLKLLPMTFTFKHLIFKVILYTFHRLLQ